MKIALVILAAGTSSRMKTAKQILPVGTTHLLGISIETAKNSLADQVFCVLGANALEIKSKILHQELQIIENINFNEGLSSSLFAALQHIQNENFSAVLFMLGDQPKLSVNYINALIEAFKKDSENIYASTYGESFGVPAIFPRKFYEDLLKVKGDKGARNLLNDKKFPVKTVNFKVDLMDIDSPDDYNKLINN